MTGCRVFRAVRVLPVLSTVALVAGCGVFSSQIVQCPETIDEHPLAKVEVFDGAPEELGKLTPTTDGITDRWDVSAFPASRRGYIMACTYAETEKFQTIVLPAAVKVCTATREAEKEPPTSAGCN